MFILRPVTTSMRSRPEGLSLTVVEEYCRDIGLELSFRISWYFTSFNILVLSDIGF